MLPRSTPNTRTLPSSGVCSRIISRRRVDLPEPLPPITAKISARRTSKSIPLCTTWLPKRVTTRCISRTISGAFLDMSEVQHAEGNGEKGISHDHQEDRLHHSARGLQPDTVGTTACAKALKATHHGNDGRKNRCLADAHQVRGDADGFGKAV